MMRARTSLLALLAVIGSARVANADCCRVVKIDDATASSSVRVCEPGPAHTCGAQLFAGTLTLGQAQDVCAAGETVVYQELDAALGSYGDPVEARCDGGDVEL